MADLPYPWAREAKRLRFSQAYNAREAAEWTWNRFFGPSHDYAELTQFVARDYEYARIDPRLTLVFIGDVMPGKTNRYRLDESVNRFVSDADYLILNLEGLISDDRFALNAVCHDPWILEFLAELFPADRTVMGMSNNHSADCGWSEFQRCYESLRGGGYRVLGRRDEPAVWLGDEVLLATGTQWSNHPGEFMSLLSEHRQFTSDRAAFSILYPHWGYEMQLYPRPEHIERAHNMLQEWDMIVGHHSHCPQPITDRQGQLLAYSVGNFCRGTKGERFHWGLALKVQIGPTAEGRWSAGRLQWRYVFQQRQDASTLLVTLRDQCPFFEETRIASSA